MLYQELTARFDIDKISAQGERAAWWYEEPEVNKYSKYKKGDDGLTDIQRDVIDLITRKGACNGATIARFIGYEFGSVHTICMCIKKKGLIDQDKKTRYWYVVGKKPEKIVKDTKREQVRAFAKSRKIFTSLEARKVTPSAQRYLRELKCKGLLNMQHIGAQKYVWKWIG